MHQSDTVEFESYIPSHSVTKIGKYNVYISSENRNVN